MRRSYQHSFWLKLLLPLVHAAYRVAYTILGPSRREPLAWHRTFGSILSFLFGSYPSLITTALSTMTCRKIKGHGLVQVENLVQNCTAQNHAMRRTVAYIYLVIVIVIVPVRIFLELVELRAHNLLCAPEVLETLGFLYDSYHSGACVLRRAPTCCQPKAWSPLCLAAGSFGALSAS